MKLYKYLFLAVAAVGFFASCSEEGYWEPYDTQSTPTYSFSKTSNNYSLQGGDTLPDLTVTVHRSTNVGEVSIPLSLSANSDIITVDSVVKFNDGEFYKNVTINVDESKINVGTEYKAELTFLVDSVNFFEHNFSISGNKAYTLSFKMEYVWASIGMAKYTDDFIGPLYGAPNETYEVEVYAPQGVTGLYRVMNAYGAAFPYNEDGDYDASKDYYFEIDATDPEGVYINGMYSTGLDWGDGVWSVTSYAYYYMTKGYTFADVKAAGYCGTLVDGVITFPAKSLLAALGSSLYYANQNSAFMLDLSTTSAE